MSFYIDHFRTNLHIIIVISRNSINMFDSRDSGCTHFYTNKYSTLLCGKYFRFTFDHKIYDFMKFRKKLVDSLENNLQIHFLV